MRTSRRGFLTTAAIGILGLTLPIAEPLATQSAPVSSSQGSLEELTKTGLPKELQDMGFTLGDYANRGTEKQVIILTELPTKNTLEKIELYKKQSELVSYLTKLYGLDSLALDLCSGEYPELYYIMDRDGIINAKDLVGFCYKKDIKIPVFGLDSKPILKLEELVYGAFIRGLRKEDVLERLREIEGLSGNIISRIGFNQDGRVDIVGVEKDIFVRERNRLFSERTEKYTTEKGLRKTLAIVKSWHVYSQYPNAKNFQEYLPCSYLIMHSPGATKKDLDLLYERSRILSSFESIFKAILEGKLKKSK